MIERITVIVPVRAGSSRFPNKNLETLRLDGRPERSLLSWKLEQLLAVFPPDQIVVSSDSALYLEEAAGHGVRVHRRSPELSTTDVPFSQVVRALVDEVKTGVLGWAPVTSPLFGPRHMRAMIAEFGRLTPAQQDEGFVTMEPLQGFFAHDEKWLNFASGEGHRNSQDLVQPLKVTWGFTLRTAHAAKRSGGLINDPTLFFTVPSWASVDIDFVDDLRTAELLSPFYNDFEASDPDR